ncbi:transporter substrate-binding domain-containing protein [Prosthecomicrobium sp. N25]|uniref:transporter substrate-binding domain-containing protein n=1 Tax=Prosthecomicrobium sp. N25 TaxID=3129254 RepID=UPI0030774AA7
MALLTRTAALQAALSVSVALALQVLPAAAGWELRVCADPDNLPYSNRAGEGFDNRIAEILARDLGARLVTVWLPDLRGRTRQRFVQGGECDMVMGVIDGQAGFLTSYAYYRTGYVFLHRQDAPFEISSLDDPVLKRLRIGLPGGTAKLVPPAVALANRGIVENQVHFIDRREPGRAFPPVLEALSEGSIDIAVVWGPVAGDFVRQRPGFALTPVTPEIDVPFIPMVASLAIGFRPEDEGLREDVDAALARNWDRLREVLTGAGVPLVDMPAPAESLGRRD